MKTARYESPSFRDEDQKNLEVTMWQNRIDYLVSSMRIYGTEVWIDSTTIASSDSPSNISMEAVHRFIFPPQEVVLETDDSEVTQTSSGTEHHEHRIYQFDQSKVKGHLHLEYGDSLGRIKFMLMDYLDDSELHVDLLGTIADTVPEAISKDN
jgi:hypothetical protein